jgi:hypothetical protein
MFSHAGGFDDTLLAVSLPKERCLHVEKYVAESGEGGITVRISAWPRDAFSAVCR